MFILDDLLIGGIRFVLDKVATVVNEELDNPQTLHRQLLEAQMQLEEGTIDEGTFATIERDVITRLRDLKGDASTGGIADADRFGDVEIEFPDATEK